MKAIILGGTGLIGKAVSSALMQKKHEIVILTRTPEKYQSSSLLQYAFWDGQSTKGIDRWFTGEYFIINLAGESIAGNSFFDLHWSKERKQAILFSRLNAGRVITDAVYSASDKPFLVIQASAIGYYGSNLSGKVITEESPPGNDFLAQVCTQWEDSTSEIEKLGTRRAIVRIGIVLSNQGGALPKQIVPFRFFLGGTIGDGQQWYSWIHIQDLVNAIIMIIENQQMSGVYNLCAPNPVTNKEFTLILSKVLRRPALFNLPEFLISFLIGESSLLLTKGQRVSPQRLLQAGFIFQFSDLGAALRDLLRSN